MIDVILLAMSIAGTLLIVICVAMALFTTFDDCYKLTLNDFFSGRVFETYFANLGDVLFSKFTSKCARKMLSL